jgi:hypothetical protein
LFGFSGKNLQDHLDRFSPFQKEIPVIKRDKKDEFSLALERSFSSEYNIKEENKKVEEVEHKEPVFASEDDFSEGDSENVFDSQKVLNGLKKEWQEIEKKQEETADSLAYPFGGWTDVDKYQK